MKNLIITSLLCPIFLFSQETAEAYFNDGKISQEKKDYKTALSKYNSAIKIDSTFALAYIGKAEVYFFTEKLDESIIAFSRAIFIDEALIEAFFGRAKAYVKKKLYQNAIDDYSSCIVLYDEKIGKIKEFNKNQMLKSKQATFYHFRGLIYEKMDEHFLAINDQSIAIGLMGSTYGEAYIARGMAKYYEGLEFCQDFKIACEEVEFCEKWEYYCK